MTKMTKKYSLLIVMLSLGFILFLTACGSKNSTPQNAAPKLDKNTVLIEGYTYKPAELKIEKGETVTWINQDTAQHTATGDSFDSKLLKKGQSFSHTFNETGTYPYICTPHPYMKGLIIVE